MAEAAADNRERSVAGPRAVWRLVHRRDFGPYFFGNALSATGTWFQSLAASLLVYRLTHSALLLGVPDTVAGFIVGVFGAGAVTAALVVAGRVAGSRWRMALTLFLLGAGVTAFSLCPWLALGFVFLFVGGFGYLASNTSATTRLQLGVEEWQRGRIMALWSLAFLGLRPFASLLDGAIAHAWSVRAAGVILAAPALLAAAAVAASALARGRGGASSRRGRSPRDTSRAQA